MVGLMIEINNLKFSYRNFEADSILWMVATINGEKIIYINDNLNRVVDDININKDDFIKVAKERYKKDLMNIQETLNKMNSNKKIIRLTEDDLKNVIKESVNKILKENTESFGDEFERLKNDCISHGEDFGFELMNKNGEYEYGDIEYDIDNNSLSCLGICIRPNLMYNVEKNLCFLYDRLLKNGFSE